MGQGEGVGKKKCELLIPTEVRPLFKSMESHCGSKQ